MAGRGDRHKCDDGCRRICSRCAESHIVHGMNRWGIQPVASNVDGFISVGLNGGGGLLCDRCAKLTLDFLHQGAFDGV